MEHERNGVKGATLPLDSSGRPSGHDDDYPLDFGVFPGESVPYGMGLTCILRTLSHIPARAKITLSVCNEVSSSRSIAQTLQKLHHRESSTRSVGLTPIPPCPVAAVTFP